MRHLILKQMLVLLAILLGATSFAHAAQNAYATTGVNFRSGPGKKYRVITGVSEGDTFKVLSTSGNWSRVRLDSGRTGYIFSRYVKKGSPSNLNSEGGFCAECDAKERLQDRVTTQSNVDDVLNITHTASGFGSCVMSKFYKAMKWVHANRYGGRYKGRGRCQEAIRLGLTRAGVWQGGGYGNAKDVLPTMLKMGFKNIKTPGMTSASAPSGSILVYGPKLPGARCKESKGNVYGHIEFKVNSSSFLYDGNPEFSIQQAYGKKCRPLIGAMVMGDSCPTCSKSLKRTCGG